MTRARRLASRARLGAASAVAALAAAALAACQGNELGTISLGLTTAPGSTIMDGVARLRLTFTNPRREFVIDRTDSGFDFVLDLEADGAISSLVISGFDSAGGLVATGMTPLFPLSAVNARIVVYMAPPMSIGAAPVTFSPARTRPSFVPLTYGAVLAGGIASGGAPSDALQIYNVYDHTLATGEPLPAPRAGALLTATEDNNIFLFGGTGPEGTPTGTLWFFNTAEAPDGRYVEVGTFADFARADRPAVRRIGDRYLLGGAPPAELSGARVAAPMGDPIPAFSSGATTTAADGVLTTVLVAEDTGDLHRIHGTPAPLGAQRKGGVATALPGRRLAVLSGESTPLDALVIDAATGALTPIPGALSAPYASLSAAATPRFLVVAGIPPGGGSTTIEVLDGDTLARLHLQTIDDEITAAIALPNEGVLLVGTALRLFTPPPPE